MLGVTGSVAAYKAVEIARTLQDEGYSVCAIMTESAKNFINPYLLTRICEREVIENLWKRDWHIPLTKEANALLIAPATANIISKFSCGICDDALSTIFLSFTGPKIIAPCMNEAMYKNPILQENIEKLRRDGVIFVGPKKGRLLCKEEAIGRLAEPEEIKETCIRVLEGGRLSGKKVLVTAGPTFEMIDEVRYIGNLSSAKMGYAMAKIAYRWGADVTLVKGPTVLPPPFGVDVKEVVNAEHMKEVIMDEWGKYDIFCAAAAVSDYRPKKKLEGKIKRKEAFSIELIPNTDILRSIGERKGKTFLLGFCVETKDILEEAKKKLKEKNLDLIVANTPEAMGKDEAKVMIIKRDGSIINLPLMQKIKIAERVWEEVIQML